MVREVAAALTGRPAAHIPSRRPFDQSRWLSVICASAAAPTEDETLNISATRLTPDLDARKFRDPDVTADGAPRAFVDLSALKTLWFNTGTLCNLTCSNCYIESSPTNDRLAYITLEDVQTYLDEISREGLPVREIGLTGGEPFMNPEIIAIMEKSLQGGFDVLVLTNAMRPMMKLAAPLLDLGKRYGRQITLRVSLDHYTARRHEEERGGHTWKPTMLGVNWLAENGFRLAIAGRTRWGESEERLRSHFGVLFQAEGIPVDASDPAALVLFPEMDETVEVPEITTACWNLLNVDPNAMMCATSRMVVKRRGAAHPMVLPCNLLPYDPRFEMGGTLASAHGPVRLNHRHCAKFCVLGGGSCGA